VPEDGEPPFEVDVGYLNYFETGLRFRSDEIWILSNDGTTITFDIYQYTPSYGDGYFEYNVHTKQGAWQTETGGCCGEILYRFDGRSGFYDFADEDDLYSYLESAYLTDVRFVVSRVRRLRAFRCWRRASVRWRCCGGAGPSDTPPPDLIGLLQLAVLPFHRLHLLGHLGGDASAHVPIHFGLPHQPVQCLRRMTELR
jgi:hypothetical protein